MKLLTATLGRLAGRENGTASRITFDQTLFKVWEQPLPRRTPRQ